MRTLSLFFVVGALLFGCGNHDHDHGDHDHGEEEAETVTSSPQYQVSPFTPSASFPDAKIESVSYEGGKFKFEVEGESYQLGVQTPDAEQKMCANSAKGQHIHLIVDNAPYAAYYTDEFEHDVTDGEHYLLAFLSRSYHESIKTTDASTVKKVTTEGGNFKASEDVAAPMLFYSRPKGTYVGEKDTKKVMLDFYLANVDLGADYKVKAEINGEEHMIEKWQPYYVEGLPMGENTIKLTLVDAAGNAVDAPLNPVERTFTLKEDPAGE